MKTKKPVESKRKDDSSKANSIKTVKRKYTKDPTNAWWKNQVKNNIDKFFNFSHDYNIEVIKIKRNLFWLRTIY